MTRADVVILGGGPAGLAAAYFAQKRKTDFILLEAGENTGGNCRTIWQGDFGFDTGAHRFHDKDAAVTKEISDLLGEDLKLVEAPSSIYFQKRYIDFPLSPVDLLRKMGVRLFLQASWQILQSSFKRKKIAHDFESFALSTYGEFIARNFLINYSEKLWGFPADQLSPKISGKRLKGLDLKTFLIEGLAGRNAKTRHLDGSFYYPLKGFGQIMEKLEASLASEKVFKRSKVTGFVMKDGVITGVEVNKEYKIEGSFFVNTLPLSLMLQMLPSSHPEEIRQCTEKLKYRHLILGVFFLNKERFSSNASLYFPEKDVPFTRIYEPKNRSSFLAPPDKTCIVVEIPCQINDEWWKMDDQTLEKKIINTLMNKNLLSEGEIAGFSAYKIPYAYPILDTDFEKNLKKVRNYLERYENLYLSGRSGLFTYSHLHDQMNWGREIVEKISGKLHSKS